MNTMIDVGASGFPSGNLGANKVTERTQVFLFEPIDIFYNKLVDMYEGVDNFHLFNLALSDKKGEQIFYLTEKTNCSSLYKPNEQNDIIKSRGGLKNYSTTTVKVDTLDNILGHLEVVDYLKIDTQGSEYEILKGGEQLLPRIKTIQCEVEFSEWYEGQKLANDVEAFLISKGFKLTKTVTSKNHADYIFSNTSFK